MTCGGRFLSSLVGLGGSDTRLKLKTPEGLTVSGSIQNGNTVGVGLFFSKSLRVSILFDSN